MNEEWDIDEAKVVIYLSDRTKDYSEVSEKAHRALVCWQRDRSYGARDVLLFWLQTSSAVADSIFRQLSCEFKEDENLTANLELLEGCSMPCVSETSLLDELWHLLGSTEVIELTEKIAHIIVLLLPNFISSPSFSFKKWWPEIYSALTRTQDKNQTVAGLKVWLGCLTNSAKGPKRLSHEVEDTIRENAENYFRLIELHVSKANKLALQILELSLSMITEPIDNRIITYDPNGSGVQDAWARYIALIEILGIDTSIHQTADSLADFAALLSAKSPIPARWAIALINVGLCHSNNEGIRVLTMQLVMALQQDQMHALAKFPHYVAHTLYPKFLQTPNFVILSDRCLQAEHIQSFTRNVLKAFISEGNSTLQDFIFQFAHYLLEHAHSFEPPRALIANVMLDVLPEKCLTRRETVPLLAAARATVLTYNSKAMADLYYDLMKEVVAKTSVEDSACESVDPQDGENSSITSSAMKEWAANGILERSTLVELKAYLNDHDDAQFLPDLKQNAGSGADSMLDIYPQLQLSYLDGKGRIAKERLEELLSYALYHPKAMNAAERKRLSVSVELAFDFLDCTSYELCEETFAAFSEIETRFAAFRCYVRSNPKNVSLEHVEILWNHMKDATLRIIDRQFHLAFISFMTTPGAVSASSPPTDICIEIVELSVLKRNLLVPLSRGLLRFAELESIPTWVFIVMARIFAFVRSQEYTVRLEEMVAHEFDIYEKNWGEPESHGRAIAAAFLWRHCNPTNMEACNETILDTLDRAELHNRITGSLDNIEAHRRVLYYQILTFAQRGCSKEVAIDVLRTVKASLETEANPPVRMQGEWLVGLIGSCHISSSQSEFTEFVTNSISVLRLEEGVPPRVLGSMIRICMLLYYSIGKRETTDQSIGDKIGEDLILHLIPLATSNKAVVRHRAISALYILDQKNLAPSQLKPMVASIAKVNEGGVKNSSYANESYLWDVLDTRLGPVCGGICSTVFDRYMPNTLLENDFKAVPGVDEAMVGTCWSNSKIVKQNRHGDPSFPEAIAYRERIVHEAVNSGSTDDFSRQIQTKSGTFDVDYHARRTSLIVVATLCDKPVNLGAITRLSDALGVSKLVIRDPEVMEDSQFKSTALTAEKWIPIEKVSEENLVSYLRSKKAEGYTLVGIEQTDTSKRLTSTLQFPENTLLMMGHERQGIPAEILAVLDACVEIEQLGYVRSMNIQTATAVVVQAYNQNHGPNVRSVGYAA